MNTKSYEFRSRSQRESDVDLSRNYGRIANKAVAAASQDCCKAKAREDAAKAPIQREQVETH